MRFSENQTSVHHWAAMDWLSRSYLFPNHHRQKRRQHIPQVIEYFHRTLPTPSPSPLYTAVEGLYERLSVQAMRYQMNPCHQPQSAKLPRGWAPQGRRPSESLQRIHLQINKTTLTSVLEFAYSHMNSIVIAMIIVIIIINNDQWKYQWK